ncbi:MAG: signal recognition particle-docking protein FtsY [Ilumatobacteraceae bacterium]|jgi:fused signal recognition particle receptor|nr:signal recognition particle-docking protein FtsY [Ilumatobacteraceae bacterium]MDP5068485.1 signal recognition particle-docking protein FtsY [Ilumatobacteraceae bacterium]
MIASATTNIAIALGTSGVGIAILVVLRSRRNRTRVVASPVSETVTDSAPIVVTEVVVAQEEAPIEVVPEAVAPEVAVAPSVREKAGRTRSLFASAFQSIRGRGIDSATWDELEETLLLADIGIGLATRLLDPLRAAVKDGSLRSPDEVIAALRDGMTAQLATSERSLHLDAVGSPNVWLFVGVNGVGKTTTIGKIATAQTALGTTVLMAAGDTFRAAAAEQLQVWAERSGSAFVRGAEGGDPASVIFDGIQSASAKGIQLVLGDTAGRLQNKSNLMEELKKVRRVADKAEGVVNEVLLVIDATTGQNGLAQAREFAAATDVTGIVLTKLDGSAKGGIVFAIETELGIPVKLVGLGETAVDLIVFDPSEFVSALFE